MRRRGRPLGAWTDPAGLLGGVVLWAGLLLLAGAVWQILSVATRAEAAVRAAAIGVSADGCWTPTVQQTVAQTLALPPGATAAVTADAAAPRAYAIEGQAAPPVSVRLRLSLPVPLYPAVRVTVPFTARGLSSAPFGAAFGGHCMTPQPIRGS